MAEANIATSNFVFITPSTLRDDVSGYSLTTSRHVNQDITLWSLYYLIITLSLPDKPQHSEAPGILDTTSAPRVGKRDLRLLRLLVRDGHRMCQGEIGDD